MMTDRKERKPDDAQKWLQLFSYDLQPAPNVEFWTRVLLDFGSSSSRARSLLCLFLARRPFSIRDSRFKFAFLHAIFSGSPTSSTYDTRY